MSVKKPSQVAIIIIILSISSPGTKSQSESLRDITLWELPSCEKVAGISGNPFSIYSYLFPTDPIITMTTDQNLCKPSSCGNITSIKYPFRVLSDQFFCGTYGAELACEGNTTFFYSDSGSKYRLEEIDYNLKEFRIVDAGLLAHNYSSLPLYTSFIVKKNGYNYELGERGMINCVAFVNCDEMVNSTTYLNILGWVKGQYSYVMMGEITASDVADSCTVENVIPIMRHSKQGVEDARNYSYKDVHDAMAYGFTLNFPSTCRTRGTSMG